MVDMALTSEAAIKKASIEDAEEIIELQKLAYVSEAEIIGRKNCK